MDTKATWRKLMLVGALSASMGLIGCGDDDDPTFDGGVPDVITTDVPVGDVDLPDTPTGDDAGPGDAGDDAMMADAGDDAMTPDAGMDAGAGPVVSGQITAIRDAADGIQDPALALMEATVTYVKPLIGSDPAGFFVQGEAAGPALYVAVDPDTLDPVPAVGDVVAFNVTETETSQEQHRVIAITDYSRSMTGLSVDGFVQDLSMAGDLVTALDDYESELVVVTGTITGDFGFAGTDHSQAQFVTEGLDDEDLSLRIPTAVIDEAGIFDGCVVTAGPAPFWRFRANAQASAFAAAELTDITCPAPAVTGAVATDNTTVVVSFSSALDAATVEAGDFAFTGGSAALTASDVVVAGASATVTVNAMEEGTDYTVTVTGVADPFGTDIDPGANTAMFVGAGSGVGVLLLTEISEDGGDKAVEITNVGDGNAILDGCILARHANGSTSRSTDYTYTGSLAAGESFVVCRGITGGGCDVDSTTGGGGLNFNGNDALELVCSDVVADSFGVADGANPGDFTGTNSMGQTITNADMTLRRACDATADTDVADAFDLGAEWDATTPADPPMSINDYSGFGEHCP